MSIWWMIGGFILVLSPIIIVHELGHFWTAKKFGVRVEEFGLGYPPRAMTLFERDGTKYTLNWIPLGGFIRPAGEDDPTVPGGLASASKTARFSVLIAGAVANFIFAFFILWIAFMIGRPEYRIAIGSLLENNAVESVGVEPGDIFLTIDGNEVSDNANLLISTVNENVNKPIELVVERDGQPKSFIVTPIPSANNPEVGVLNVSLSSVPTGARHRMSVRDAARESAGTIYQVIALTLSAPKQLIEGTLSPSEARPISVVGISQIIGAEAQSATTTGDFFGLMFFAGIINVGLGFTNLLPLPALDGGRILFVLIEAIRGRRIEPEREGMVHLVGMLLLLGLVALMIVNDVVNPIIPF